ncbi:MAG: tRNA-intron lyase [Candidatus Parvarchaeota archaeon]|nr:tRNA-intron lyase [Candidatus Parvarchaeota archaeon]MCW1301537.1 tRNA-intron lyase [Candidatus Parvarchaeota archaeon]
MDKMLLVGSRVVISDQPLASSIYNKGAFGVFEDGKLYLSLEEALYLKEKKKLEIIDNSGKRMNDTTILRVFGRREKGFAKRYIVFKNLRDKGYIPKAAFKYGGDFRVYDKGDRPGKEHAEWILKIYEQGDTVKFKDFSALNRVAHSVKKSLLIAVVDDENSVTFYEVNWRNI